MWRRSQALAISETHISQNFRHYQEFLLTACVTARFRMHTWRNCSSSRLSFQQCGCYRPCSVHLVSCMDTAAAPVPGRCSFLTATSRGQFHSATRCTPSRLSRGIAAASRSSLSRNRVAAFVSMGNIPAHPFSYGVSDYQTVKDGKRPIDWVVDRIGKTKMQGETRQW